MEKAQTRPLPPPGWAQTALIGAIGTDSFGTDMGAQLATFRVKLALHRSADQPSGMAFIDVGPESDNIIRLSEGANATLTDAFLGRQAATITSSNVLLLQNEIPLVTSLRAAEIARWAGVTVIMDPAPAAIPFWIKAELAAFDILTPNAHGTYLILGTRPKTLGEALDAARHLTATGLKGTVVTMGDMGVAWSIGSSFGTLAAPRVRSIDTVGAGDCFNGALLWLSRKGGPWMMRSGLPPMLRRLPQHERVLPSRPRPATSFRRFKPTCARLVQKRVETGSGSIVDDVRGNADRQAWQL